MSQPWDAGEPLAAVFEAGERRWLEHWRRGPTQRHWTELPAQPGDLAPDRELLDTTGQPVRLSSTWATQSA